LYSYPRSFLFSKSPTWVSPNGQENSRRHVTLIFPSLPTSCANPWLRSSA
jgi:hypothetical protein